MIGLYEIQNIKDNKRYVGSSLNIAKRFYAHRLLLRTNKHHNIKLQRAWNKYGEDAFIFVVLKEVDKDVLKGEEQSILDAALLNRQMCYNISIDAIAPTRGRKSSKKTVKKFVELRSTSEWKERQSASLKKYFSNPEARKKSSEAGKLLMSDPTYKKRVMEASRIARDTPEVRKKISDSHKGRPQSDETRKKKSATLLKRYRDPQLKQKFVDIISSESVRSNMSEGAKKRWSSHENRAEQARRTESHFSNPDNRLRNSEKTKSFFANPENRKAAALRQPTRLSKEDIDYIRKTGIEYGMQTKLVKQFNLSPAHISNIVNNKAIIYTASL